MKRIILAAMAAVLFAVSGCGAMQEALWQDPHVTSKELNVDWVNNQFWFSYYPDEAYATCKGWIKTPPYPGRPDGKIVTISTRVTRDTTHGRAHVRFSPPYWPSYLEEEGFFPQDLPWNFQAEVRDDGEKTVHVWTVWWGE